MSKRNQMLLWIVGLPFVASTAMEFMPFWLAWPITFLSAVQWFGACAILVEL